MGRNGWIALAWVVCTGWPGSASAWTRAQVQSARADVTIDENATMDVTLRLTVQVEAGWLQEMAIAGLDPSLTLPTESPPRVRSENGVFHRPIAQVDPDGRILLTFTRKDAPRRGLYDVVLRYVTKHDFSEMESVTQGFARVPLTLPGWETGLQDVSVKIIAPVGSKITTEGNELESGVEVSLKELPRATEVTWKRVHLPRMTEWALPIDIPVPTLALPPPPAAADTPGALAFRHLPEDGEAPFSNHWPFLVFLILVLLKASMWRGSVRQPLFLRAIWSPIPSAPDPDATWSPSSHHELKPRRLVPTDLMDGTTAAGLAVFAIAFFGTTAAHLHQLAILLVPVFFIGTRLHRAPSPEEKRRLLRASLQRLRLPNAAPAMAFAWEVARDENDAVTDARVRIHTRSAQSGLLALSLIVCSEQRGFALRRLPMLLIETRAQSAADDLVRSLLADRSELRGRAGRTARVVPWSPRSLSLIAALTCAPTPAVARRVSRGSWFLGKLYEQPRQAA